MLESLNHGPFLNFSKCIIRIHEKLIEVILRSVIKKLEVHDRISESDCSHHPFLFISSENLVEFPVVNSLKDSIKSYHEIFLKLTQDSIQIFN